MNLAQKLIQADSITGEKIYTTDQTSKGTKGRFLKKEKTSPGASPGEGSSVIIVDG
jgi:hypothetical protein